MHTLVYDLGVAALDEGRRRRTVQRGHLALRSFTVAPLLSVTSMGLRLLLLPALITRFRLMLGQGSSPRYGPARVKDLKLLVYLEYLARAWSFRSVDPEKKQQ